MSVNHEQLPYRPCVGVMLVNTDRLVFTGRRIDMDADAWQMPQGGIDRDESPRDAALRELREEIGTDRARIVAESRDWLTYDLPSELVGRAWGGRFRGQRQKWFLMRFDGRDDDINIATEHPEFDAWRWSVPDDLPRLIIPFKRPLYLAVLEEFRATLAEMR